MNKIRATMDAQEMIKLRAELGLSPRGLAELCALSGSSVIWKYEAGLLSIPTLVAATIRMTVASAAVKKMLGYPSLLVKYPTGRIRGGAPVGNTNAKRAREDRNNGNHR